MKAPLPVFVLLCICLPSLGGADADLRKKAEAGDAVAQYNLGIRYANKDDRESAKWIRKAAKQGLVEAQHHLGWMHENGRGVKGDDQAAVKWYSKAAEQGFANSQASLGWMYANGGGVDQDHKEAVKWYRKAAEQGNTRAQVSLGNHYFNGEGVPRDWIHAYAWYSLAASSGQKHVDKHRDALGRKLTPGQITQAAKVVAELEKRIDANSKGKNK